MIIDQYINILIIDISVNKIIYLETYNNHWVNDIYI